MVYRSIKDRDATTEIKNPSKKSSVRVPASDDKVVFNYSRSQRLGQNSRGFGTSLWGHWTSEFTTFSTSFAHRLLMPVHYKNPAGFALASGNESSFQFSDSRFCLKSRAQPLGRR